VQSFRVENAGIRDMLQDMAIEEFKTSIHDAPLFKIKAAVRTSWTVREAAGQPHTFRRAAMSCGTCGRISRPKPGRVRRTSLSDSIYEWLEKESAAVPQGSEVWICGDCHVGNLGPVANAERQFKVEIRDFDQTVIGNPAHDLIRLGLSLAAAAVVSDLPGLTIAEILEAMIAHTKPPSVRHSTN
jgi:aminoglycoside phosphotransferase (APT) family kinase protein